ncbi:outer membrane beta-barrel protein [bacterium]|nr:outer membrane beta-barrel protein [bacterium]
MKVKKLVVAFLIITLIPLTTAFAQRRAGSWSLGGFAGTGTPMAPEFFKDYWNSGVGFGGEFIYNLSSRISVGARFQHLPFPLDQDEILAELPIPADASLTIEGGNIKANIFSANILAYLTSPESLVGFYVIGGASLYQLSSDDVTMTMEYLGQTYSETQEGEEMDDKFGINGGAGIEINAGGMFNVFAEGKYHYRFGKEEGPTDAEPGSINIFSLIGGVRLIF